MKVLEWASVGTCLKALFGEETMAFIYLRSEACFDLFSHAFVVFAEHMDVLPWEVFAVKYEGPCSNDLVTTDPTKAQLLHYVVLDQRNRSPGASVVAFLDAETQAYTATTFRG
jgi:hypothetical protein